MQTRFPDLHRHVSWREPFATVSHQLADVANRQGQLVPLLHAATAKLAADPLAHRPDLAGLAEELAGRPTTTPPPEEQADARVPGHLTYGLEPLPDTYVLRTQPLDELRTALFNTPQPGAAIAGSKLATTGMGGIGKTILARALAHDPACRARFPQGVLWADLGPAIKEEDQVDAILLAWGTQALSLGDEFRKLPPKEKANALQHRLQNTQVLLVLDDVWAAPPARLLARVRPAGGGLLVTTRLPAVAAALALRTVSVDVLELSEALELLANHRGRPIAPAEQPLAEELVRRPGLPPPGVKLAGAQLSLRGRSWQTLLDPLRRRQGAGPAALQLSADDREASLQVCFDLSYGSAGAGGSAALPLAGRAGCGGAV